VATPSVDCTVLQQSCFTPNASISFKAIEQIATPSAAEETPRAVWGSIPSRHGRCIFWIAGVHTNAIRFAQPEGYAGSVPPPPLPPSSIYIFVHALFLIQMSREQELGLDRNRKKFDAREEYFVSLPSVSRLSPLLSFPLSLFPAFFFNLVVNVVLNFFNVCRS
jgi:hypothetical protein